MTDVFAPQSPTDSREFVKSFLSDGTANFDRVEFTDLDFSAIFGKTTTSTTQNAVEYGVKGFTLDEDNGSIKVGYPLQCMSLDDPDCFMQGVVTLKDTTYSPAYIEVAVTIISPVVNTTNNWELSVIPLAGFSINPSATVGISTTSIDASGAGPFTFTTQTGKLFMQPNAIGGTVVCTSLADPKTYLFARIVANSGTSLYVSKIYSNATSSVSSWSIQMFDGPDDGLPLNGIEGLTVSEATSTTIAITEGFVRDSTDTVDLVLTSDFTKDLTTTFSAGTGSGAQVTSGNLNGTVSIATGALTGTGTQFLTDFPIISARHTIINTAGGGQGLVTATASDTSGTTSAADVSNATYTRGGWRSASTYYWAVIARRDTDGVCDIIAAQSTLGETPDLPSGYTFYRTLAFISMASGSISVVNNEQESLSAANVIFHSTGDGAFPNARLLNSSTSVAVNFAGFGSTAMDLRRAALTGDVTASANSNATTIANDAVTNAKSADMAAYTLKGRNAGTTGDPSDIDISALTEKVTVANADLFLIQDSEASNAFKKVQKVNIGGGATFPQDFGLITEAATLIFDSGTVP